MVTIKYNLNFAQLKENKLVYAPNILVEGDVQIINATVDRYAKHGYLPIERTETPEIEGYYFTPKYYEVDGKILQAWESHEIPDEATEADYINALEGLGVNFNE